MTDSHHGLTPVATITRPKRAKKKNNALKHCTTVEDNVKKLTELLGRRTWCLLTATILTFALSSRGQTPPPPPPDPALAHNAGDSQSLRKAILDLAATYKERYGDGRKFLAQLDEIDKRLSGAQAEDRKAAQDQFQTLQRQALAANPLVSGQPIVFILRPQYQPGHHNTETFFPAEPHECNSGAYTPGGALKLLDVASGKARTLVDLPKGTARDPEVSFDGKRILFSMRKDPADSYHLYEIDCGTECGTAALGGVVGKTPPRAAVPQAAVPQVEPRPPSAGK